MAVNECKHCFDANLMFRWIRLLLQRNLNLETVVYAAALKRGMKNLSLQV